MESFLNCFFQKIDTSLGARDMQNLVQYSSQLELSGFRPLIEPVIPDPNRNGAFWESVDLYLQLNSNTNQSNGGRSRPRTQYDIPLQWDPRSSRQLEKYDLEIRDQEFIESSAPFLLPPLDISP